MSKEANEQLGESRERVEQFGHRRGCPPVSPPNELTAGGQPGGGADRALRGSRHRSCGRTACVGGSVGGSGGSVTQF